MSSEIRLMTHADLAEAQQLYHDRLALDPTPHQVFEFAQDHSVLNWFMLPEPMPGHENYQALGLWTAAGLQGMIGLRSPQDWFWYPSFIFTRAHSSDGLRVLRRLMVAAMDHQEQRGFLQWYIVTNQERFAQFQRITKNITRPRYHHYEIGHVPAQSLPERTDILRVVGRKIYPYAITISLLVSRSRFSHD